MTNDITQTLNLCQTMHRQWQASGQWKRPENLTHCLRFAGSELGEADDAIQRQFPGYVRNNDKAVPTDRDVAIEIFDAFMMGAIALKIMGWECDVEPIPDDVQEKTHTYWLASAGLILAEMRYNLELQGNGLPVDYHSVSGERVGLYLVRLIKAIEALGYSLPDIAAEKLALMDAKRQGVRG